MSYRNPRFCYQHMLRDFKSDAFFPTEHDAPDTGANVRLYDDQSSNLAKWIANGSDNIVIYKNAATNADGRTLINGALDRVIIPRGHDQHNNRSWRLRFGQELTFTNTDEPTLIDGVKYSRISPSSDIADMELDPAETFIESMILELRMFISISSSTQYGIGELWWTKTEQPVSGIAHGWEDVTDGIFDRIETRSGARFTQKRGESKRRFSLRHEGLTGADLKVYDDLFIGVAQGLYPFWYEHPDSGGAELLAYTWVTTTSHTTSNSSVLTLTGSLRPDGDSGNVGVHSAGSTNPIEWVMPVTNLEAGVTTDWRGFVARWQVQMDDWDTVARGDLQFFVESEVGAGGDRARTVYDVGGQANTSTVTPPWNRMEIDLDKDATGFTGTGPADLSAVQWFGWIVNRPDTVQVTRYGDFFLLEKSKRPILVEMTNYRRFQDGAGPSGPSGPSYQISMEMLEVTS